MDSIKKHQELGIDNMATPACNRKALIRRKIKVIQAQAAGIQALLKKNGIQFVTGRAYVCTTYELQVETVDGAIKHLAWDKLILATGSLPATIPSLPFNGRTVLSSDHVLDLLQVPESITIVGAGVIGCEFAFIWNSLGAKVTLVEA